MLKKILTLALLWGVAGGAPALAAGNNHQDGPGLTPPEFSHRLEAAERELAAQRETAAPERATPPAALSGERFTIRGLVEVEAAETEDFTENSSSDISLATVEIGIAASLSPWAGASLVFLYEEDQDEELLQVDQGTITLGNQDLLPLHLTAGKMYVPFGSYASSMISDPLTLELGETKESALELGFTTNSLYGSLYGFNGDIDETDKDNVLRSYGARLGLAVEEEGWGVALGLDWLNNMADTDGLQDHLATTSTTVDDLSAAIALHAGLRLGPWNIVAEYVAALDAFGAGEMDFKGRGAKPAAFMAEVAYATEISGRPLTMAMGYQQSEEAVVLGLPESRVVGSLRVGILDNTSLAFEYAHDHDYGQSAGGSGGDGYTATIQLAYEF